MTETAEQTTVTEPRKLGLVGKALVALMVVVTAGLVVGTWVVIRAKRIEDERRVRDEARRQIQAIQAMRGWLLPTESPAPVGSGTATTETR